MLTGEFGITMDDKGRILVPSKLRSQIAGNILWATKGPDENLWLYTPEEWEIFSSKVMDNMSPFSEEDRVTYRSIIAPSQELEIDRVGRILIPPSLKLHADLKKEVLILGVIKFMEIWDVEKYALHKRETSEMGVYRENQKRLKDRVFFKN
ncbi:MAG: division/cell wall cluster transcriptional repressor MraZ [Spirochaetia bacterium]|jgi:MraZ protein|nr:division/cell wall cluster transcriptional repressor MraZ [Spirochaetia bacterium]